MKKIILTGLAAGALILVVSLAVDQIFTRLFPVLAFEYQNPAMFRAWTEPLMQLYFLYPFILGLILTWIWSQTKTAIKGAGYCAKGLKFGSAAWLLTTLPGMLVTYASFQISFLMIAAWTVGGLISLLVAGCLLAKFNP